MHVKNNPVSMGLDNDGWPLDTSANLQITGIVAS